MIGACVPQPCSPSSPSHRPAVYAVTLPEEETISRSLGQPINSVQQVVDGDESVYAALTEAGRITVGRVGPTSFGASFDLPNVAEPTGLDVALIEGGRIAVSFSETGSVVVVVVAPDLSRIEGTFRGERGRAPRLLASPDDDALLLAYTSTAQTRPRVLLTRLICRR